MEETSGEVELLKEWIDDEERQHSNKCDCHSYGSSRKLCHFSANISHYFSAGKILDIRNHLIGHKAHQVFLTAYHELLDHPEISDFETQMLFMIDRILDQFAANHDLVKLLSKHLSWGFFKDSLYFTPGDEEPAIFTIYEELMAKAEHTYRTPEMMMYLILEMISGASYNVILYQQPVTLEELKPHLYETVKGIMRQYRED